MRTAKTLIRLGGCPGWSESSLGGKSFCWFCHEAAQMVPLLAMQDWMQDFGKGVRFEQFKAKTHEISKFSPKSPWKWNNSCQKGSSSNPTEPPLDPPPQWWYNRLYCQDCQLHLRSIRYHLVDATVTLGTSFWLKSRRTTLIGFY